MGLRGVMAYATCLFLVVGAVPWVAAEANEPVVYSVAWGDVDAHFFPHPGLCVGPATTERHREAAPGYHFDSDGCLEGARAVLGWIDAGKTGHRALTDPLYLQPAPGGRVQAGDARITPSNGFLAGSIVKTGDADEGLHTRTLNKGSWDFVDKDGDGRWSVGDVAYFDVDQDGYLSPGDLVLDAYWLRPMPIGTPGMYHALQPLGNAICYLDNNGNTRWDLGEPIYLSPGGCMSVDVGDLRLTATRSLPIGVPVREADLDFRNPLTPFEAPQGVISIAGDRIVIDLDGSGTETQGDLLLGDGIVVLEENDATGATLRPKGGWAFLDMDGSGTFTPGDLLYVDMDKNGRVSAGDVRMTALFGAPLAGVVQPGDPDDSAALPAKRAPQLVAEPEPTDQVSKKLPAPSVLVVLVVLTISTRMLRRD